MTPSTSVGVRPPIALVALDVGAKAVLLFFLGMVAVDPAWGNLEGKAPLARALTYPLWAFVLPTAWLAFRWTPRFPWAADLCVTLTAFSDILGNRFDLYDRVSWFDDAIHFVATGLLAMAIVLLTTIRSTGVAEVLVRAVGVGITAALAWELWEYNSFVTRSDELPTAYADTLVDLMMGWLGAVTAALLVHVVRRRPRVLRWRRAGPPLTSEGAPAPPLHGVHAARHPARAR